MQRGGGSKLDLEDGTRVDVVERMILRKRRD